MEGITREEHAEFAKRIEDEQKRQNNRLERLENTYDKMIDMQSDIREIKISFEGQSRDLRQLREKIEEIEREPADTYRSIKRTILTVIITAVVTAAVAAIINLL